MLTYSVAAWEPLGRALAGLGAVLASLLILSALGASGLRDLDVAEFIAIFTITWAMGLAVRSRREMIEARVHAADERADLERELAGRAVAEERLRIAQELHDVVAHSMSVIAVQAGVGSHLLDEQPEQARSALNAISDTSRSTLAELRRLLGVLRDDDGSRAHAPAPSLGDVPQLVDEVRAVGVTVELEVEGEQQVGHSGIELSAYRVIQEALTNVIKHAGPATTVEVNLRYLPDALHIEVIDDGRGVMTNGAGSVVGGHGQMGMRERVEVWGGDLSVGPHAGGGYEVRATLPYGDAT